MLSVTNALGDKFGKLGPEAQKRALERQKFIDDLSRGAIEVPEDLRSKMDERNKIHYDESYKDTRCPGRGLNEKFCCESCGHLDGDICKLRTDLNQYTEDVPQNRFRLMPYIHLIPPEEYDIKVANLIFTMGRLDLLRRYDRYMAKAMEVNFAEKKAPILPKDKARLAMMKKAAEAAAQDFIFMLHSVYELASLKTFGERAPSDEALRDAYEKEQYEMRRDLGEPVIFKDGRCWFDGYVVGQGYLPGPFPGLELWMSKDGLVDPEQFSQWLMDTESERKQSKLPPVGWMGTPVCGVYAIDGLKFYANTHHVLGRETYRLFMRECVTPASEPES